MAASGCIDDRTNIACFAVFARRKNGSLSGRRRSFPTKPKTRVRKWQISVSFSRLRPSRLGVIRKPYNNVRRHMISKILDRYNKWRNRCRSCEVDGIDKSLIGHCRSINAISKTKTVIEYKCDECETLWVLADNAQFISKVVRNELYAIWKSQS